MEGVLLVDKPKGPSSFAVIRKLRGITKIKRIGHAGTLDPLASGLLVVCFGRYTKLANFLTDDNKVYEAVFRLGQSTTTDDAEGEIIDSSPWEHLDEQMIRKTIASFVGKLSQTPPKFSAIKIDGKRAYALARAECDVKLTPRLVEIYAIEIISMALPDVTVRIHCSKGTYVRAIARDVGQALLCGAYAKEIRRIGSGGFSVDQAINWEMLDAVTVRTHLLEGRLVASDLECIEISPTDCAHVVHGRRMTRDYAMIKTNGLLVCDNDLIALVKNQDGIAQVTRVF